MSEGEELYHKSIECYNKVLADTDNNNHTHELYIICLTRSADLGYQPAIDKFIELNSDDQLCGHSILDPLHGRIDYKPYMNEMKSFASDLGYMSYVIGAASSDEEEIIKYYKLSIEKGNILATIRLADFYNYDESSEKLNDAAYYYKMAANKGDVHAMITLGYMYLSNYHSITSEFYCYNEKEAVRYLIMATNNGQKCMVTIDSIDKNGYIRQLLKEEEKNKTLLQNNNKLKNEIHDVTIEINLLFV